MEAAKKARKIQRALFTRCLNILREKSQNVNISQAERFVTFQLLEARIHELENVNAKYIDFLLASDIEEKEVEVEIESHEDYKLKFLMARLELTEQNNVNTEHVGQQEHDVSRREKPFKKPTLQIPKFNGSVSEWLHFWSHFRKIHEDRNISKDDKLEYLKLAMEKDSKADNIVQGYPTSVENYEKAFNSLKERYGRDDLLIEYYTRELLSLALQNATNKRKDVSVSGVYDKISAHIRALETLGVTTDNCATMLYPLVESSLPEEVLRTWQRSTTCNEEAAEGPANSDRLARLLKFLEGEVKNEERINMAVNGFSVREEVDKTERNRPVKSKAQATREVPTASVLFASEEKRKMCIFCKDDHENASCEKAKKLSSDNRKNIIKENSCCFKCIKRGHRSKDCKVKISCGWCGNRHALLVCPSVNNNLNNSKSSNNKNISSKSETVEEKEVKEHNLASFCNLPDVYLQTLRVILYSDSREKVVRAVIDSGSQRSYIRSDVAEKLGYKSIGNIEIAHSLFGGVNTKSQTHEIYLARMKSLKGDYACNFQVMDKHIICADIPTVKKDDWLHELREKNISISDLDAYTNDLENSIDVLIGADVAGKIMTGKKYDLANGVTVVESRLGWSVMGKAPTINRNDTATTLVSMVSTDRKISELWDLDTLGIRDPIEKSDRLCREKRVKENFSKTVYLNENNRYTVDLPWIDDHAPVSHNFDVAMKRLDNTVKKLKKDGLYDEYDKVFTEWRDEDIIELVPKNETDSFSHYLPHRHVIKLESTTKIRPVFDASASEKGFPSLNQCLEKGPNLIELIPDTLHKFREHDIAVVADIRKAFLQIEINKNECDFFRFFWFSEGNLRIFRHKRVVFGLTCSPFLLGAVLEHHFESIRRSITVKYNDRWSSDIIEKLAKSFYVDNCTTSVKSVEELDKFISVAKDVLAAGGFELRGWEYTRDSAEKETTLVLGVSYNKARDTISINPAILKDKFKDVITKRSILSMAHKVFDPIGFTCPVTLLPKLMLKKLHKEKIDWDEPVNDDLQKDFFKWYDILPYLNKIEITRKFGIGDFSLHTFCDASKVAYATVTFLRVEGKDEVELKFLAAKSRVAPEETSIPRLELLAASIGSRQTLEIIKALGYEKVPVFYWSDSTTVLAWLNRDKQWGIFVWNRVREIRELTSTGKWRYVPGEMNPADLPSRGCQANQLFDSRWWEGPAWLRDTYRDWPYLEGEVDEAEVNRELKKSAQTSMLNIREKKDFNVIDQFSSYTKMIRFFAIMIRFKNFKLKIKNDNGKRITYQEIYKTEMRFLRHLQGEMFLPKGDPKLATIKTFVHTDKLIRLKTKIVERNDSFPFLCPILLDSKHKAVELLVRETHEKLCHAGVQTVMCQLREKFWILSMRRTVKSIISKCIVCKKHNVKPMKADPVPLPIHRVKDAAVFEVTGVDLAGPIFLR